MSASALLNEVKAAATAKTASADREYKTWVAKSADGKANPAAVVAFLEASGRDVDQFMRDVERLVSRRGLVGQVRDGEAADRKAAEVDAEVGRLNAEFEAVRQAHLARVGALAAEAESHRRVRQAGASAEAELRRTAPPAVVAECRRLDDERRAVMEQLTATRNQVRDCQADVKYQHPGASEGVHTSAGVRESTSAAYWREKRERSERRLPGLQASVADLEQQIADLDDRIAEAMAATLTP